MVELCVEDHLVEQGGGAVLRGIVDGILLALKDRLDALVYLWGEARAHEGT